jgi:hypothetical protein
MNVRSRGYAVAPADTLEDNQENHSDNGSRLTVEETAQQRNKAIHEGLYPFLDSYRLRLPWYLYTPFMFWFIIQNNSLVGTYDFNFGMLLQILRANLS